MNNSMTIALAAMCDCWVQSPDVFNPIHINTTAEGINTMGSFHHWNTFYLLYWALLHDKSSAIINDILINFAKEQMIDAPCGGTYFYNFENHIHPDGYWSGSYKWEQDIDYQEHGKPGFTGNYNGLDYMLFYNLYQLYMLREHEDVPVYINLCERSLTDPVPYCNGNGLPLAFAQPHGSYGRPLIYNAFRKIESSQLLDTIVHLQNTGGFGINNSSCSLSGLYYPSHITYRAGESIILKPGFRVMPGSYFHAYIKEFDCWETPGGAGLYGANFITPEDTSSISDFSVLSNEFIQQRNFYPEIEYSFDDSISSYHAHAWPNPFTTGFNIRFYIQEAGRVHIDLYDVNGLCVYSRQHESTGSGQQNIHIHAPWLSAGVYACVLRTENQIQTINLVRQ